MTFQDYIISHGLSEETLKKFNLSFDEKRNAIKIPITNGKGETIYHKYRHLNHEDDPDTPKYTFDSGSHPSLFNLKALEKSWVIITEGEIDAIRLDQENLPAISGTAGAQSWQDDWTKSLEKKTAFLCYDNDEAGIKAIKLLAKHLPKAYVVLLPEGYKDICDYLKEHTKSDFLGLLTNAKNQNLTAFHFSAPHKTLTAKQLLELKLPQIIWLIKDLLPAEGFTALTAPPYSYKSYLTEYFALCLATQTKVFNQFETTKSSILIIDKENSKLLIQDRFKKLGLEGDPQIYLLDDPDSFSLANDESLSWLIQFVLEKNIKLLILDSFVHIHKGDENDSIAIASTFEQLKKIPCAILFIHHHRKTIKFFTGTLLESIRGSSDIAAELTSHIAIDIVQTGIKITQGKNRWGQLIKPFIVTPLITEDSIKFEYGGEVEEETLKSERAKNLVISYLQQYGESARQIILQVLSEEIGRNSIDQALRQMETEKLLKIRYEGRSKYFSLSPDVPTLSPDQGDREISASQQSYIDEIA